LISYCHHITRLHTIKLPLVSSVFTVLTVLQIKSHSTHLARYCSVVVLTALFSPTTVLSFHSTCRFGCHPPNSTCGLRPQSAAKDPLKMFSATTQSKQAPVRYDP
jgi:hypothetical protein